MISYGNFKAGYQSRRARGVIPQIPSCIKARAHPTREEFTKIATVAAAGVLLIGLIGFIIYLCFDHKALLGF